DDANRLVETDEYKTSTQAALGAQTIVVYEQAHNRVVKKGPRIDNGAPIETISQYDSLGRLIDLSIKSPSLAQPYGTSEVLQQHNEYDAGGNVVLTSDGNGNATKPVFDGANRKVAMIEGYGSAVAAATTYTYDRVGDLVSIRAARVHAAPSQAFP